MCHNLCLLVYGKGVRIRLAAVLGDPLQCLYDDILFRYLLSSVHFQHGIMGLTGLRDSHVRV